MSVTPTPELLFFTALAPASVHFHILIFSIVLVCFKMKIENESYQALKTNRIYLTFLSNFMCCFVQTALLPRENQRNKHQLQVPTIQRTFTSRK